MATYIPNATQVTEPLESRTVESAALEFRTGKVLAVRGVYFPAADTASNRADLPTAASRAGRFLAFDVTTGQPITGPLISAWTITQAEIASVSTVANSIASVNSAASNLPAINAAPPAATAAAASAAAAAASAALIALPLSIASGGTGATTLAGARTALTVNNVDNTSDASKPVSTAQQTALNLKANVANPAFTGTITTTGIITGTNIGRGGASIASNTTVGTGALQLNTTGSNNTASGVNALQNNTTGNSNTAHGLQALQNNTTGTSNTANGQNALQLNTTGVNSTANGVNALQNNTTGNSNTANGVQALQANTTGISNTASGVNALLNNTTGSGNTAINPHNSGGGYAPVFDPVTENNRFCMGSTGVTNAYIQVAWTVVSDARDKTNFAPVPHGLEFVKALKPISYQFRADRDSEETNGGVRYGFKAQDVLALEGGNPVIVDNEDADKLRMIDTALIPVLVNALQELNAKFDAYVLTHP